MSEPQLAVSLRTFQSAPINRREAGRRLLRATLSHLTCLDEDAWRIESTANGRPLAHSSHSGAACVSVSISHSGPHLVVAASSERPVGIDVEVVKPRPFEAIADALNWNSARLRTRGSISPDGFYRAWALWESLVKLRAMAGGAERLSVFHALIAHPRVFADEWVVAGRVAAYTRGIGDSARMAVIVDGDGIPDMMACGDCAPAAPDAPNDA